MKSALERLGFGPCHHMMEVVQRPGQVRCWLDLAEGRPVSWESLLPGYASCVDWPAASYWRELAEHYPRAKVILTVRDPERWLASMNATIFKQTSRGATWSGRALHRISATLDTDFAAMTKMTSLIIGQRVFDGRMGDAEHALRTFAEHVAEVKAVIPAERLLVFQVSQGREPLCDFLGVPVPDEPFPQVNDAEMFARAARSVAGTLLFRRSR